MLEVILKKYNKEESGYLQTVNMGLGFSGHIEDLLIEDEIEIDNKVELKEVFDLYCSNVELNFDNDETDETVPHTIDDYLNFSSLKTLIWGLQIIKDGTKKYAGYIKPESFYKDKENDKYNLTVVNWYKWMTDSLKDCTLPELSEYTITEFFGALGWDCEVFIGTQSEIFVAYDYNKLRESGFKVADFIFEMQKNYAAYIYVDENMKVKFVGKNYYTADEGIDITDDILEEDYKENIYEANEYNSVLMNVKGTWSGGTYEGWAFVYYDSSYQVITGINADLSNIPDGMKYIDVRQQLDWNNDYDYSFSYVVFQDRDEIDRYNDWANILRPTKRHFIKVDRTDIQLFNKVIIDETEMQVFRCKESLLKDEMYLELIEVPID